MSLKLALIQENIGRSFMWISRQSNDIYWGFAGEAQPSHYSYHGSGLLHHRYDRPIPKLPELKRMVNPEYRYGFKEPLSTIKGIEPIFAGWVSLHPVTVSNLPVVENMADPDLLKCELPHIAQTVIGFELDVLEASRPELTSLLDDVRWETYWITHKIFILEKERPIISPVSKLLQQYIIDSYPPWMSIRFWDGLPPVLSSKHNEWEFKGLGLAMPAVNITELRGGEDQ